MPKYTIIGDENPFLHVTLNKNESILCESNAMVMMEDGLNYLTNESPQVIDLVKQKIANSESFIQQKIQAVRSSGDCLFSSYYAGAIEILELDHTQYYLSNKAFIACDQGIQFMTQTKGHGKLIFGGSGKYVFALTSGKGKIAVGGYGALFFIDISPDKETIIDLGHVVAWESQLNFELANPNSGQTMFNNIINAVRSSESTVLKIRGKGRVLLCSRNKFLK